MACATSTTQSDDRSPLLRLPAELRNDIYRFALVASGDIIIKAGLTPPPEPGLLATCRKIRSEALSIYYEENRFSFGIRDVDATMMLRFKCRVPKAIGGIVCVGRPNWINLKAWLETSFHTGLGMVGRRQSHQPAASPKEAMMEMCFEVMDRLKKEGLSWEKIENVLEDLHTGMTAVDPAWK